MISSVFNTLVYNPLYNGLIFLMDLLPWADVGLIVIAFTIIVKLILFPLAQKSVKTQVAIRAIEPQVKQIREKYKDNKEEQAKQTFALYKQYNVNPFSGFLLILIQLPIIFALYFIFLRGGLPTIQSDILYSFISEPVGVNTIFLGFVNVLEKSIVFAVITAASQYVQARLVAPEVPKGKADGSLKDSFSRSMNLQMRYVMPAIVGVIAYTLPAIVAIYWTTSNLFTIGQELFVRRRMKNYSPTEPSAGVSSPVSN